MAKDVLHVVFANEDSRFSKLYPVRSRGGRNRWLRIFIINVVTRQDLVVSGSLVADPPDPECCPMRLINELIPVL